MILRQLLATSVLDLGAMIYMITLDPQVTVVHVIRLPHANFQVEACCAEDPQNS